MILSVFIINKAGGLIYQKTLDEGLVQLSTNDYLVMASTFQSIHAISSRISPIDNSSGIQTIETEKFNIHCLHTETGVKFLVFYDPHFTAVNSFAGKLYEIYSDYVMKNPFYTLDMPIKCYLFDSFLQKLSRD